MDETISYPRTCGLRSNNRIHRVAATPASSDSSFSSFEHDPRLTAAAADSRRLTLRRANMREVISHG